MSQAGDLSDPTIADSVHAQGVSRGGEHVETISVLGVPGDARDGVGDRRRGEQAEAGRGRARRRQ